MYQQTQIRTYPDGSIDYRFYENRGRRLRSRLFVRMLRRLAAGSGIAWQWASRQMKLACGRVVDGIAPSESATVAASACEIR